MQAMNREALTLELEKSRRALGRSAADLKWELDFKRKTENSIREYRFAWLGGAAAFGFLIAGSRSKRKRKKARQLESGAVDVDGTDPAPKKQGKKKDDDSGFAMPTIIAVILGALRILMPLLKPIVSAYAARKLGDIAGKLGK